MLFRLGSILLLSPSPSVFLFLFFFFLLLWTNWLSLSPQLTLINDAFTFSCWTVHINIYTSYLLLYLLNTALSSNCNSWAPLTFINMFPLNQLLAVWKSWRNMMKRSASKKAPASTGAWMLSCYMPLINDILILFNSYLWARSIPPLLFWKDLSGDLM